MADSVENILNKLSNSPYKKEFKKIYKDGVTQNNLIESIVEFEKALITPNSKFDKYLRGDSTAITAQEKRGYEIFKEAGCISCHNGVNVGGNMFQKVGLMVPYKSGSKGRYNLTLRERDKFVYKVPSLRNIELTAPYLHDGTVQTLRDAIIFMREYQLDIIETDSEVDDIEAFLKTLTGEMPEILKDIK